LGCSIKKLTLLSSIRFKQSWKKWSGKCSQM